MMGEAGVNETPIGVIDDIFKELRKSFNSGKTKSLWWRKQQIEQIYKMCDEQKGAFASAVNKDFHRPAFETIIYDCGSIRNECNYVLNHIDEWVRDEKVSDALVFATLDKYIHPEPLGIALIIGSWNYPFLVTLLPLIGAIAAGNCVIVKPSELAPNAAHILAHMIRRYLDTSCIQIVLGGIEQTETLLKGEINKVFYTGSATIGKTIMKAAAEKLIPVTLECGGKNPVYVADDANIEICAKRIAWGKTINCGQTCLAPDYILCSKRIENRLIPEIIKFWKEFYTNDPLNSDSYCRIVNNRHFHRVKRLINANKVIYGGDTDANFNYISPTIMIDVDESDDIMQEEIFGPILPFLTINDENEAIQFINKRDKPLALYIFTSNNNLTKHIINSTSSGSTCINDVIYQIAPSSLPFGGVGLSGVGRYRGKYSFYAFSHQRSIVHVPNWAEPFLAIRNPPYTSKSTNLLERLTAVRRRYIAIPTCKNWFLIFLGLVLIFSCNTFNTNSKANPF